MAFLNWLRRSFSSGSPEEEAAEREEYGGQVVDRGEAEIRRELYGGQLAAAEGAELAEDELETFERPRDPAP
jgi:hypothetical protein